ncbi:MAG: M28 family peptidase [Bacteroidetes bacterium]|nr:M28 family peptidase [Bacteroidota bacterium]
MALNGRSNATGYFNNHVRSLVKSIVLFFFSFGVLIFGACNTKEPGEQQQSATKEPEKAKPVVNVPAIDADSAYAFVAKQVSFGPRIPGSKAHANCAEWLESKLRTYIPEVMVQKGVVTTFDQKKFEIKNIIPSYQPENKNRILLCAHWDTRPFADRDQGINKNKAFDGANDGASGVGVLIEIARQLSIAQPQIGVDIILFDLEDYGQPEESSFPEMQNSWCLGSQYWAKNLHVPGYFAKYGILLDMVGAKGAVFPKEGYSVNFAPALVDRVWNTAAALGYGSYFINATSGGITDDHVYINQLANIPCIDIIHYDVINSDFFGHHHKVSDTMEQIDPGILKMVGQTVLQVVFEDAVAN